MTKTTRKKIILTAIIFIALFGVARFVSAQVNPFGGYQTNIQSELGLGQEDPRIIIANVIRVALGFLGIVVVILILYSGWLWMTAAGRPERIDRAKKLLISAVIGLTIILASFAIATFVLNRLIIATGGTLGGACVPACAPSEYCCSGTCQTSPCSTIPPPPPPLPSSCDSNVLTSACDPDDLLCGASEFCESSTCTCQPLGGLGDSCDSDTGTSACDPDDGLCATYLSCETGTCTCQGGPVIEWISPVDSSDIPNGAVGNIITVGGQFFGSTTGEVLFWDGADYTIVAPFPDTVNPACTSFWTDNSIIVVVPTGAVDGPIKVRRADLSEDTTDDARGPVLNDFDINSVVRPGICLVNPSSGYFDDPFNLTGINFSGAAQTVKFGNEISSTTANNISGWTNLSVDATVPNIGAGNNTVFVRVDGNSSNVLSFSVLFDVSSGPLISYIDPPQGPEGQYITIYGSNFNSYLAGTSLVEFDEGASFVSADTAFPAECQNNWWRNTYIIVKVPSGLSAGDHLVQITNRDSLTSPPENFNVTIGAPGPGLCFLDPHNGSVGQLVNAYGDNFGSVAGTAEYYNSVAGPVSSWSDQQTTSNVPVSAQTGPFQIITSTSDVSNSLPFAVGACASDLECDTGEECCSSGTYWDGICRVSGTCNAGSVTACEYGWTFTTSVGSPTILTCSGYNTAQACVAGGMCPNSPGECQTTNNPVVGECGDNYCNITYSSQCAGSCSYNSSLNKCVLSAVSCDQTNTTIISGYTAECRNVGGAGAWQADFGGGSCPLGSFLDTNGWCTVGIPGSPATCSLCADGFVCQTNQCVINTNVCPGNSSCVSDQCTLDNDTCECCCRVGFDAQDCCAGLTCEPGGCGSDSINYGLCTGCRVELDSNTGTFTAAEQSASDAACNCSGGSASRYCDVSGNPLGACQDLGTLGAPCYDASTAASCNPSDPPCIASLFCDPGAGCTCQPVVVGTSCDANLSTSACEDSGVCALAGLVCDPGAGCTCQPASPVDCDNTLGPTCDDPDDANCLPGEYCDSSTCTCVSLAGSPGDQCIATIVPLTCDPSYVCQTDYSCIDTVPSDCGRCCCDPTIPQLNSSGLRCEPGQDPCSGSSRGLYCGCSDDLECGSPLDVGCGLDTCCRDRASVVNTSPTDGATNVCRNVLIAVEFDQEMNINSFTGNVVVVGDYGINTCPAGTSYLTLNQKPKNKFDLAWQWIKNLFTGKGVKALPGNFCAVLGTVSGYNDSAGFGVLTFNPSQVLDPNTTYYVIIKGDSNTADATPEGVLNKYGIGMAGPDSESFNFINYNNSRIFSFVTMPETATNDGICKVDYVRIEPRSYLFQTSVNDSADDPDLDTIADSDKVFKAYAVSSNGQEISPSVGLYDWNWSWSSENPAVATANQLAADPDQAVVVAENVQDAKTYVRATAVIVDDFVNNPSTVGQTEEARASIYVFLCANPWPPVINPANWPWQDNNTNCDAGLVGSGCINNNFEFYYCRDLAGGGTVDDLPTIQIDPVIRGTDAGLLKEYYFLREAVPDISGSSLSVVDSTIGGSVTASWGSVAGAAGYKLYYGTAPGNYINFIDVGNVTTSPVSGLSNDTTYYFTLTAYYDETTGYTESTYSAEVSVVPTDQTAPAIPAGIATIALDGEVDLSWNPNSDDTIAYVVYFGTVSGVYGSSENVGDATAASVTNLTNGVTYYFSVSAIDGYGNESAKSIESSATPIP